MLRKSIIRKPISVKIFTVIILVALLQGTALFLISSEQFRDKLVAEKIENMQATLVRLQETLQFLATKNEVGQIQKTVTSLGVDININIALLLDDSATVIASTRIDSIGNNMDVFLQAEIIKKIKQYSDNLKRNVKNILWRSEDGRSLYGMSPILLGRLSAESLRPDKIGILFLHYDMGWIDKKNQEVLSKSFMPMMLMLIIAGLGLAIYFNISISRRIKIVNNFTTRFLSGDYSVRIKITDNDELSDLGQAFNEMAQKVYEQHEELLDREQNLAITLNSIGDAIITIDELGIITSFNKTAEVLFGYTLEEVIGQNIRRLMPNPYADKHDGYLQTYLQTGAARVLGIGREVKGLRKNKQSFPMRLSVAELPVNGTGIRRFIGTCQDLTQIKQQEKLLRHSQKMDALGKLTSGIAHDYNNMLGVILGYSDLLIEMLTDQPKLAGYATQIHHAGARGAKLTKKLLSFSRQETPEAAKLDINALLQAQLDMLQKTLTVRIKLLVELADKVWPIWLDSSDLEDAVLNMSINAMHAMNDKPSSAQLTIRTANQTLNVSDALILDLKEGDYVRLSLTDTGVGMDEKIKEKIFDPFFSTKGAKGTGLGLSQVFGFVKRAGGTVKVYSEPGHGSEFVLYFPRYLDDDVDVIGQTTERGIVLSGNESILVVDDEEALRKLATLQLKKKGYSVVSAENGKQALKILANEPIDLMLSDVIMPDMDGYQLVATVREKYPTIKIQLASGFADERHIGMVDESLHQQRLHKPFNSHILYKSIRALLDDRRVRVPRQKN